MRTILEIICRRFPTIVWITLIVFVVTAATTYMATPIYVSEARITVPIGSESTVPTTAMTTPLYVYITRAEQIQTQIEVLQSRNLIEQTIDALPDALFEEEEQEKPEGMVADIREKFKEVSGAITGELRTLMQRAKLSPVMSDYENFVLSCAARLTVRRQKETDVISLSFRDPSPQVAQQFLNKFLEVYVREKSTSDSAITVPFFAEQEEKLRKDLIDARDKLANFRKEWGILDLVSQRDALMAEHGRIISEINQARSELVQIEVSLKSFREALGHESPESVMPSEIRNDQGMAESLRNLATLLARESRLWTEMGVNHPDIANIQVETSRLREHIASEGRGMLNSRAVSLRSLLEELERQRDSIHNQVLTLESKNREMNTLETDVSVLETALTQYAEKRETSRVSAAMEAQQLNAIRIVEAPNLAYKPSSPRVLINLVLGLMMGIILGLAYVFFRSRFSSTIYTPEDLRDAFSGRKAQGDDEAQNSAEDNSPRIAVLPDMVYPRAQGLLRRLLPIPKFFDAYSKPEAVVRKMPENSMTMMGRKFFYHNNERHIPQTLMLSGTGDNVGATTCAKLLAEHLRKVYTRRVLLVETGFSRQKKRKAPADERDFASWLRTESLPEPEEGYGMVDVLPAGILDESAQAAFFALSGDKLEKLRDGYDVVIFDADPVVRSSTALHLAALVEEVILVARSEVTRREVLKSTQNTLRESGSNLTGAVCNFRRFYIPNWMYRIME